MGTPLSHSIMAAVSKKRKFVADGVFYAELNDMLTAELADDGYAGVNVRVTPSRTEIIIKATQTQNVLGERGRRIRELTAVVQQRFNFPDGGIELYAQKVQNRGLCAIAQAESLRYKLAGGLPVRRACYGVVRFIMEAGAKGCEVIVTGKLRAARAKAMKFVDGYMIKTGHPAKASSARAFSASRSPSCSLGTPRASLVASRSRSPMSSPSSSPRTRTTAPSSRWASTSTPTLKPL